MPPNLMPAIGAVRASRSATSRKVTALEWRIAKAGMRPQMVLICSSRVRVLCLRTAHLSMLWPSMPKMLGSTITESSAARPTALIAPKATDFRKACGKISRPESATATIAAEKTTVLPAVAVVFRTAVGTSLPSASSSRKRETMNRP